MTAQNLQTEVITFHGIVQGVGFRPTVYRIAQYLGMKGRVRNMGGIVQIVCTGYPGEIDEFVREINLRKPPMARISGVSRKIINPVVFHEFSIGQSSAEEDEIAVIPADIAVCDECMEEFRDPGNPRYKHPFISCTNCGPRYSILERLPYDRETTTMADFPMCGFCGGEYADPSSRRYHAQTVSCHNCGPQPIFSKGDSGEAIRKAIRILDGGGVVALKGVGGYYLVSSPFIEAAVQKLREIKRREQKPFAVMFSDVDQVSGYCRINETEKNALLSPARPIVLLERVKGFADSVCNTSRFIGAFLPSFGLQYLLLDETGPLIMTSANVSELPIITSEKEMCILAGTGAAAEIREKIDGVLYNERRITAGLDDSVVRVVDGTVQLIRRSKGYVPAPVYVQSAGSLTKDTMIFAAGGHLKSAMAFSKGAYSYLSRHIGDLDSIESEAVYRETFYRMKSFFDIEPDLVVCDLHPRYYPTIFSETLGLPVLYVQHHHAHIASVMAEHGLAGPVIGVAFDGTGHGTDGAVWGGEVLICEGAEFERFSHLKYINMIGGDSSMKDGWKSALSYLTADRVSGNGEDAPQDGPKEFGNDYALSDGSREFEIDLTEIKHYCEKYGTLDDIKDSRATAEAAIRSAVNTVKSSSMGRLFDAVSAMLGIHYENRYEGECAVMLENAAQQAIDRTAVENFTEQERLALAFHMDVASAVLGQCRKIRATAGVKKVCLSGGVFQNKILMEEALRLLRADGFDVYYNIHVPPNDGGIALGQNYIGMLPVAK